MAVVMIIAQSHSGLPLLPTLKHHLPLGPSAERKVSGVGVGPGETLLLGR